MRWSWIAVAFCCGLSSLYCLLCGHTSILLDLSATFAYILVDGNGWCPAAADGPYGGSTNAGTSEEPLTRTDAVERSEVEQYWTCIVCIAGCRPML